MSRWILNLTLAGVLLLMFAPAAAASGSADVTLADPAEASVEQRDDGSLLIDGKYVIRGAGTADDPYRVGWDLLNSAASGFDEATGKLHVPARVAMLHNKHVRITGFTLAPIAGRQVKQILLMFNQWDGCCVGTPPTPFDSIEASLAESIASGPAINVAHLTGKLVVEPELMDGWLLGVYRIDGAQLQPAAQ